MDAYSLIRAGMQDVPTRIKKNLYLSGHPAYVDRFRYVFAFDRMPVYRVPERLVLVVYPFEDSDQTLDRLVIDHLAHQVIDASRIGRTLVHCMAGANRSALVVARALMIDGMTADEAIALIRRLRGDWCLSNQSFVAYLKESA